MFFKQLSKPRLIAAVVGILASASGCGLFGKKDEKTGIISSQSNGCYDRLSDQVKRYFEGRISQQEWESTFDCVNEQIDYFQRLVRPSSRQGYTENDIASLTRRFLITSRNVSDGFVRAVFKLKASMVGGNPAYVTANELDQYVVLSNLLKKESVALLPLIQARAQNPSAANSLALGKALRTFGDKIADHFATNLRGTGAIHRDEFLPFARELLQLTGGDETLIDRYGDFVQNLKVVSAGGRNERIEAESWAPLIRDAATFGGLYLTFKDRKKIAFSANGEESMFYLQLVKQGEAGAKAMIDRRGGKIALGELNALIDTVPWSDLDPVRRAAIKKDLPNILTFTMGSGSRDGLEFSVISKAVALFERGMRGQIHLQRIYANLPEKIEQRLLQEHALKYRDSLTGSEFVDVDGPVATAEAAEARRQGLQSEVDDLIATAKLFVGLFPEEGSRMVLDRENREFRTRNHMEMMHWFRVVIRHLLSVYGTGDRGLGTQRDLAKICQDYDNILRAWKLAHPALEAPEMASKRFREANLFMPSSNGDEFLDEAEGTYYLAFLFSSGSLSNRIFDHIVHETRACPIVGRDDLELPAMEASCFRQAYFSSTNLLWSGFPGLVRYYGASSTALQTSLQTAMESAARRGGVSEKLIGGYDIDSFAALPHYVEDIMEEFDLNGDEVIDEDELMGRAFRRFQGVLRQVSGMKREKRLRCTLAYLVKFGRKPKGFLESIEFLAWCARPRSWNIQATRGNLYKVIALLSEPQGSDQAFGLVEPVLREED